MRRSLAALLLLTAALAGVAAGAPPCGSQAAAQVQPTGTLTSTEVHECQELRVQGGWVVGSGGRLILRGTDVVFHGTEAGILVLAGGALEVDDASFARDGTTYKVEVREGATLILTQARLASPGSFSIEVPGAFDNVTVIDAADAGLEVRGASHWDRLTIDGAATGVRIRSGTVTFDHLDVQDTTYAGVHAMASSQVVVDSSSIARTYSAAVVEDNAVVRLRNSTVSGAVEAGRVIGTLGWPALHAEGTAVDPLLVRIPYQGRFSKGWFAAVAVTPDAQAPETLAGAHVSYRDTAGSQVDGKTIDGAGRSRPTLVPVLERQVSGGQSTNTTHNPWTAIVRQASSASSAEVDLDQNRVDGQAIPLVLARDQDTQPPIWPSASALSVARPVSRDGTLEFSWPAADDTVGGTKPNRGIARYELVVMDQASQPLIRQTGGLSAKVEDRPDGGYTARVRAIDLAGNAGPYSNEVRVTVDHLAPSIVVRQSPAARTTNTTGPIAINYHNVTFSVTAQAIDSAGGPATLEMRVGSGAYVPYAARTISQAGQQRLTYRATDSAGNQYETTEDFVLDASPPILQAQLDPALPDGDGGWRRQPARLLASASDAVAGVEGMRYRNQTGALVQYGPAAPRLNHSGEWMLRLEAVDRSGNVASTNVLVKIDREAPDLAVQERSTDGGSAGWSRGPVRVFANATDQTSGLRRLEARTNGGPWSEIQSPLVVTTSGTVRIEVRAIDVAGNDATVERVLRIDPSAPFVTDVDFRMQAGGLVDVDWQSSPPLDAVSGIASIRLEAEVGIGDPTALPLRTDVARQSVGPLPPGSARLRIVATDAAGWEAPSPWRDVQVTAGPLATGRAQQVRAIEVLGLDSPDGFHPRELRLYVDDELVSATAEAPYELAWDTTLVADGKHEVRLVATDEVGQQFTQVFVYDVQNGWLVSVQSNRLAFGAAVLASGTAVTLVAWALALLRRWPA